ncbi:MAG: hypothetical protein JSU94_21895 [Phycisphaerales bacterium]|nr:MAG: hypothetical protein JSU94_21895 [Phycisphaerales bacterium]
MKCPKCRRDNPEYAAYCRRCEFDLSTDPDHPSPDHRKTSPVAIAAFILSLLSFGLYIFAAIPALLLASFARADIEREPWRHTGRPLARKAVLLSIISTLALTAALFYLWTLDAPPIPNDYTVADLRSARPEFNETFELLRSITGDSDESPGAAAGLTEQDIETIGSLTELLADANQSGISAVLGENRPFLEQAWSKTENARRTIARLAEFEQIADLTEPRATPASQLPIGAGFLHLGRLYLNYAQLRLQQGDVTGAIGALAEFDCVARKLSISARTDFTKLICLIVLQQDMRAANAIANSPRASRDTVIRVADHFTPLTDEHLSTRNAALFQYLMFKAALTTRPSVFKHGPPLLKVNSTLRLDRDACDRVLSGFPSGVADIRSRLAVWPQVCSFLGPVSVDRSTGRLPLLYRLYNPGGAKILEMFRPGLSPWRDFSKRVTKVIVVDDLLQIVMNKRLARPFSLKARAYGDNYIIDLEDKKIFSPGPDLAPNTKDDIALPIDPEVLGFEQ